MEVIKVESLISGETIEGLVSLNFLEGSVLVTVSGDDLALVLDCMNYETHSVEFSYMFGWDYYTCQFIYNYWGSTHFNQNSIVFTSEVGLHILKLSCMMHLG